MYTWFITSADVVRYLFSTQSVLTQFFVSPLALIAFAMPPIQRVLAAFIQSRLKDLRMAFIANAALLLSIFSLSCHTSHLCSKLLFTKVL